MSRAGFTGGLCGREAGNLGSPASGRRWRDREVSAVTTTIDPLLATEATETIDGLLRLIGHVRGLKTRDPLRTLEDALLEMRAAVAASE
jgi:hypothetical protein